MRGSSVSDGPVSRNHSSVLEEEAPFAGGPAAATAPVSVFGAGALAASGLFEVAFEAFKEILSIASLRDEDVTPIALIANAPEIAERPQRIQGARDHRFRHAQSLGETTDRMRPGGQINYQHQRHLPVGKVGLAGAHISDQGA